MFRKSTGREVRYLYANSNAFPTEKEFEAEQYALFNEPMYSAIINTEICLRKDRATKILYKKRSNSRKH